MFFITGTDTEIGKTYVSTLLFKHFREQGKNAVIMKPVASSENDPSEDTEILLDCMKNYGVEPSAKDVTPVTYPKPFAPYAIQNIRRENLAEELRESYDNLRKKFTIIIVEGIGGTLVPIEKDFFAIDIAKLLKLPVIVVAEDKLGVINHTLLSIESVRSRGLEAFGFIMNRFSGASDSQVKDNAAIIEEISGVPCLAKVVKGKLEDINEKLIHEY